MQCLPRHDDGLLVATSVVVSSLLALALAGVLLLLPTHSHAGFVGHRVHLTFEEAQDIPVPIGDPPPPPLTTDLGVTTAGSGVEFPAAEGWGIDVAETTIRFALGDSIFGFVSPISFGFRGFRLHDIDSTLPSVVGVTLALDSHVGLDPSKIAFDADNILVDMAGLVVDSGFQPVFSGCENAPPGLCVPEISFERVFQPEFVLSVQFADVSEPRTLVLLGGGLLALAGLRRRVTSLGSA
jgi:hypothetical protein